MLELIRTPLTILVDESDTASGVRPDARELPKPKRRLFNRTASWSGEIGSLPSETMGHGTDDVTTGSVVSADDTRIGYRRLGRGPGVILLHGGVNASQHMMRLGRVLADAYTAYLPDRRGRGMSGAFGPAYSIRREDEDLAALVEHTGAECVFGPANGGLFALHGAIGLGQVRRVAAYEPLLLWGGPDDAAIRRTFTTMQQMIRGGRLGEGIVFSIRESVDREVRRGHMSSWVGTAVHAFPSRVGAGLIDLFLRYQRPRSLAGTSSEPARGA
jgi:pimeloyl-ACP methyl ester carboxylesterase